MKNLLGRIFGDGKVKPNVETRGDDTFRRAMDESGDLLNKMRDASNSNDPVRSMMADLWAQRNNVPFVVTVYETVQEMKSGIDE